MYELFLNFHRTAVAMCGQDGVVFAVEKLVASKLHESGANRRIFHVDEHVGIAVAGLLADARQLVENARNEASNFRSNYGTLIPLSYLSDRVAMYMHAYTLYSSIRPFGAALMLGSTEPDGPKLLVVDPSGVHNVSMSFFSSYNPAILCSEIFWSSLKESQVSERGDSPTIDYASITATTQVKIYFVQ